MHHADAAHVAAVVGALGAVFVLVARRPLELLAGFALLVGAEAALGVAIAEGGVHARATTVALAIVGALVLLAAAALLVRFPALVTPLVLAAAPFRLPLDFGGNHRFFVAFAEPGKLGRLLPLYGVLVAAVLALAFRAVRDGRIRILPPALALPAAAFVGFASLSLLWTKDLAAGANLLAYFLLPFAALIAVVARASFPAWMPRALAVIAISLASLFAATGIWQEATHHLFFYAPNLEVSNTYTQFFRVTSLFRDPSLYGRQLVLGLAVLLVLIWRRRLRLDVAFALVALIWTGLFFSYSQSSMAALFAVALAVTAFAGDRTARRVVAVGTVAVVLAGAGYVAAAVNNDSARRVTSDRSRRAQATARVFREHPLAGVGLGAQPRASEQASKHYGPTTRFVSHTTPLTVAAELGVVGLVAYIAFLAGALLVIDRVRRRDDALGLALGAVFLALFVHALFYSGFFEDPVTWLVPAVGASYLVARAGATERAAILVPRAAAVRSR